MNIVISQPMLFPWVGMLEQVRLADVFVYYSDVQFSKGSFVNRVQIKTAVGSKWMTVPLRDLKLGQRIDQVLIDDRKDWRRSHRDVLASAYADAPYKDDMLKIVESVYQLPCKTVDQLSEASIASLCDYFGIAPNTRFLQSRDLQIDGSSSERVLEIVSKLKGTAYITGLGARNYLQHELFETTGINVRYMNYRMTPYRQLHGEFTPYVSALDLVANLGGAGADYINSSTIDWKEMIKHERN